MGRLDGKVAIIVGGGQTPGISIGNGRAVAMTLAREGAKVVVVDRDLASAQDTVNMIKAEGNEATPMQADATNEEDISGLMNSVVMLYGKIDILHNNVGASITLGDAPVTELTEEAFDRSINVNLKSMWLTCKHALPHLRAQGGSIVNISSMAARHEYPRVGYKMTKAAVIALTENVAAANAKYGVRCNAIMPGKINTPMAVEARVGTGRERDEVIATRDKMIPLGKMGTGWDIANAAAFLHSSDAAFITGASLVVDGGESVTGGAG